MTITRSDKNEVNKKPQLARFVYLKSQITRLDFLLILRELRTEIRSTAFLMP